MINEVAKEEDYLKNMDFGAESWIELGKKKRMRIMWDRRARSKDDIKGGRPNWLRQGLGFRWHRSGYQYLEENFFPFRPQQLRNKKENIIMVKQV